MPSPPTTSLPRPRSWDELEDIVADLMKVRWRTPNVHRNGRSGQAQAGVDIYGMPSHLGGGAFAGVQCKCTDELTWTAIAEEVAKAEQFAPALAEYTIATTAPRDAKLQEAARLFTVARQQNGQFTVDILFWEDISLDLSGEPRLLAKHFPAWSKLGSSEVEPVIQVGWWTPRGSEQRLELAATPRGLADFELAHRRMPESWAETPEEVEAIARYNLALADPDLARRWVESMARTRFEKAGLPCGFLIGVSEAPARDLMVTVEFPPEFEVYEPGNAPPNVHQPEMPDQPLVGPLKIMHSSSISQALDLIGKTHTTLALPRLLHTMSPALTLGLAKFPTGLSVKDREVTMRVESLAPRRELSFEGERRGVMLVPPWRSGEYEVPFYADAESRKAPIEGVLQVVVRPSSG